MSTHTKSHNETAVGIINERLQQENDVLRHQRGQADRVISGLVFALGAAVGLSYASKYDKEKAREVMGVVNDAMQESIAFQDGLRK